MVVAVVAVVGGLGVRDWVEVGSEERGGGSEKAARSWMAVGSAEGARDSEAAGMGVAD